LVVRNSRTKGNPHADETARLRETVENLLKGKKSLTEREVKKASPGR